MKKSLLFRLLISVLFLVLFALKVFLRVVEIDFIDLSILVLAFLPWIIDHVASLEINGVGKVELINKKERDNLEQYAEDGKEKNNEKETPEYSFSNLRYVDTKLGLAGMRIEIEKTLKDIASHNQLNIQNPTIKKLTDVLFQHQLISSKERAVIFDLVGILNRAVHNDISEYQINDLDWAWDLGIQLLNSLKKRA